MASRPGTLMAPPAPPSGGKKSPTRAPTAIITAPVSSWQGTIHDLRWPRRNRDVYKESTMGAHSSFKL